MPTCQDEIPSGPFWSVKSMIMQQFQKVQLGFEVRYVDRSNHPEVFCKKAVIKTFAKVTRTHLS